MSWGQDQIDLRRFLEHLLYLHAYRREFSGQEVPARERTAALVGLHYCYCYCSDCVCVCVFVIGVCVCVLVKGVCVCVFV